MSCPSEADWRSEPWNVDTPSAHEHFAGKNLVEAEALFVENALRYQEDLMFMPAACFGYYVHAYVYYLLSQRSQGDSDGAHAFFGLVQHRVDDIRKHGTEIATRIGKALERLGRDQDWYEADPAIYGSFTKNAEACLAMTRPDLLDG